MQLMNPAALWLLPAALIPLLLARRRQALPRRAVANLYLWREEARHDSASMAPRRARVTWTIVLQILCILASIAALARPEILTAPQRLTVLLDVSASMAAQDGGTTRFGSAQRRARQIVAQLPGGARVQLIAAAAVPRFLGEFAAGDPRLVAAIEAMAPTAGVADLDAALADATASPMRGSIVVLSDTMMPLAAGGAAAVNGVRWEQLGRPAANLAITRLAVRRRALGASAGAALVEVRNFSPAERHVAVSIETGEATVPSRSLAIPANGSRAVTISLPRLGPHVTARLAGNDALAMDNVRVAIVPDTAPIRVLVLGAPNPFLARALAANPAITLVTPDPRGDEAAVETVTDATAGGVDVVVCGGCASAPANVAAALVVLPLAAPLVRGRLTLATATHPVSASLDAGEIDATVGAAPLRASAHVLLRAGGAAAVTAYDGGTQRVVEIALDLSRPDLALNPAFPVLIADAIAWLGAARALPTEVPAGEPVRFPSVAAQRFQTARATLTGPDGRPRTLTEATDAAVATDTDMPGVYRVQLGGGERLFAVNVAADDESNLMAARRRVEPVAAAASAAATMERRAVAPVLALVALLLLTAEWRYGQVAAR